MRKLNEGDRIRDYQITDRIVSGAFAMTYRGRDPHGKDVFIKQFKSPTPLSDWYDAFVEHQTELQSRISASPVSNFAITLIDQFEDVIPPHDRVRCFFQVTEFVTHGQDLSSLIERSSVARWHQRVVWSKVIMGSINQFHQAKIVHTDLKPENLFLIEDPTIKVGYKLKVIDLDSAIFEGRRAPWHDNGYVGTPGYYSPEHGAHGVIPSSKSDIFSAGLILYELLGGTHPYANLSDDEYRNAVARHAAPLPSLCERMPNKNDEDVQSTLYRMLSPIPAERPDAAEVLGILNGTAKPCVATIERPPTPPRVSRATPTSRVSRLRLLGEGGKQITLNVTTTLCSSLVRDLGEAQYWDKVFQVRLEQHDGVWYATPNLAAPNDTCLNQVLLTSRTRLQSNDVVSVGRASTGKFLSPLRIELSDD